jgi:hypothetical protein
MAEISRRISFIWFGFAAELNTVAAFSDGFARYLSSSIAA